MGLRRRCSVLAPGHCSHRLLSLPVPVVEVVVALVEVVMTLVGGGGGRSGVVVPVVVGRDVATTQT